MGYNRAVLAWLGSIDIVMGAIIAAACLRGLLLGLVREAFSLVAIAVAYTAVRVFVHPASEWLAEVAEGRISPAMAPWLAGALLVLVTIAVVTSIGRIVRRGVRAVGLGFADRVGGALLGTAEGVLVVALLLTFVTGYLGRDHPALADTRALAAMEQLELLAREAPAANRDVASPPP
jgi:membrane protein required for colicin V production